MEWQQLEYFQIVAQMQHMTRAAERLSISQPALSRSISRLEEELGVPLFERQGRTILLNQFGHLFLKRVNRIMKEFHEGKQEIRDIINPNNGMVSLGFLHTLGTHIIPDLIRTFRITHPNITFQLNQNNTSSLLKQLEVGDIDLCLASPRETKIQLQWSELWNEELFIVVPVEHTLANCKSVTLDQIKNESLISFKKGYGLRRITDQLFEEAGIVPKITFEGEEVPTIAGLVSAGLGVAILPGFKELDRSKLSPIRVSWPKCERIMGMAWVEGRYMSPAVQQFQQFVFAYFKKISSI